MFVSPHIQTRTIRADHQQCTLNALLSMMMTRYGSCTLRGPINRKVISLVARTTLLCNLEYHQRSAFVCYGSVLTCTLRISHYLCGFINRLKLHDLTAKLEVVLGPDTGDLNMRVGTHYPTV
jgi:hypothetical protein